MHKEVAMKNRFMIRGEEHPRQPRIRLIYPVCLLILFVFIYSLSSISEATILKQQESLENALAKDITHCYAVEGFYPPSLSYLEKQYGLTYDKDLFFVDYRPIGSNIRPDVTIILKKTS